MLKYNLQVQYYRSSARCPKTNKFLTVYLQLWSAIAWFFIRSAFRTWIIICQSTVITVLEFSHKWCWSISKNRLGYPLRILRGEFFKLNFCMWRETLCPEVIDPLFASQRKLLKKFKIVGRTLFLRCHFRTWTQVLSSHHSWRNNRRWSGSWSRFIQIWWWARS